MAEHLSVNRSEMVWTHQYVSPYVKNWQFIYPSCCRNNCQKISQWMYQNPYQGSFVIKCHNSCHKTCQSSEQVSDYVSEHMSEHMPTSANMTRNCQKSISPFVSQQMSLCLCFCMNQPSDLISPLKQPNQKLTKISKIRLILVLLVTPHGQLIFMLWHISWIQLAFMRYHRQLGAAGSCLMSH